MAMNIISKKVLTTYKSIICKFTTVGSATGISVTDISLATTLVL